MIERIGRKIETPQEMPKIPLEVSLDILRSAEEAYRSVGFLLGIPHEEVYRTNNCGDVVDLMGAHLLNTLKRGYRAAPINATHRFIPHTYISLYPPNSEVRVLADPTWQQFLPPEKQALALPKVLIGTPKDVSEQLIAIGFTSEETVTWNPIRVPR